MRILCFIDVRALLLCRFLLAKSWQSCIDSGTVASIVADICRSVVDSCCAALKACCGDAREFVVVVGELATGLVGSVLPELVVALCALLASPAPDQPLPALSPE